jgi:outer membrane protein assembly factor BamD (BamD/ComL family)
MQPTETSSLIHKLLYWGAVAAVIAWFLWCWIKKSKDPGHLAIKWLLTIPAIVSFAYLLPYLDTAIAENAGIAGAFITVLWTAVTGLYLAIIWRGSIAQTIAKPFGDIYDGGDTAADPEAFYSIPNSKRRKGDYAGAVAEVRKQLEKFPTDFTGQMLLAEIHAENLNDLDAAQIIIQKFCQQPDHAPRNIAYALNTLADWQLKYALDRDAAREALEKIVQMLPESEFALLAQQRIGHLASKEQLTETHDRRRIAIPKGVENIGLMESSAHLAPADADEGKRAEELTAHLVKHPQDTDAREQLAVIYADHYKRLDLATDQLIQLIDQPNQPARNVVRWLNKLADLQVRHGCDYDTVWQTLSQIVERYPNQPAADLARNRIDLLRLELKIKDGAKSVKLGEYEQNIGLKYGAGRGGVE